MDENEKEARAKSGGWDPFIPFSQMNRGMGKLVNDPRLQCEVPKDGRVRVVHSASKIAMMRAHKDWPPDQPLRYFDLRAGLPFWDPEAEEKVKAILAQAALDLAAVINDEAERYPAAKAAHMNLIRRHGSRVGEADD